MKKLFLLALLNCLLAGFAHAQTRSRVVFDNFETTTGVQVVAPAPQPAAAPTGKKASKKTGQTMMNVGDGLSLKNNAPAKSKLVNKIVMSAGTSLRGFTTGNAEIDSYIVDSATRYGIDPLLIYAQMHQESAFKLKATSYKGARGLMQLMPATAMRFGVRSIYDPQQNIEAGVKYMRWLLDKFNGDLSLALAGYNAGEGAVMKYGWQIPPYNETREYVRRISARYNSIKNPYAVKTVKQISKQEVAQLEEKTPTPLTNYERNALTVRLPDGRMRLVNQ